RGRFRLVEAELDCGGACRGDVAARPRRHAGVREVRVARDGRILGVRVEGAVERPGASTRQRRARNGLPSRALLTFDEARRRVLALAKTLGSERAGLGAALGRVLAEDVRARDDAPAFDASTMDGYAVRAAEVGNDPMPV